MLLITFWLTQEPLSVVEKLHWISENKKLGQDTQFIIEGLVALDKE